MNPIKQAAKKFMAPTITYTDGYGTTRTLTPGEGKFSLYKQEEPLTGTAPLPGVQGELPLVFETVPKAVKAVKTAKPVQKVIKPLKEGARWTREKLTEAAKAIRDAGEVPIDGWYFFEQGGKVETKSNKEKASKQQTATQSTNWQRPALFPKNGYAATKTESPHQRKQRMLNNRRAKFGF